ncbi:MAG TPA: Ku protein [Candidatus Binatia bacterium]|jgi:DNA end-binding protein Ku
MARRKSGNSKSRTAVESEGTSGSRPIWSGSIDFGLVNIPVKLYSAQTSSRPDFDLLDKRDFSRVRYRRVNEKTGQEVKWDQIVKGFQYEKGEYVALTDRDFEQANVEATQSITIMDFVDGNAINSLYYDTPYYLEPMKNGRRAYALLREVLQKTDKVGVANVVLRTRQHLAALIAQGPLLVLNTLRYAHELRDPSRLNLPQNGDKRSAVSSQEIKMAEQLVGSMTGAWQPEKYRDAYHDDLLKLIDRKVKAGQTKAVESAVPARRPKREGKVIDMMHLLRQSVKQAQSKEGASRQRKTG